jgi:hypothetical protein
MTLSITLSPAARVNGFLDTLKQFLPPKTRSDIVAYRNFGAWLEDQLRLGRFNDEIFHRILGLATDAKLPPARNPYAVFMSSLRKELGYDTRKRGA